MSVEWVNARLLNLQKDNAIVDLEAVLWKKGKYLTWKMHKRYFLLSGNHIYYNSTKDSLRHRGVICLTGSNIEYYKDDVKEGKGYYAIQLKNVYCNDELCDERIFYCASIEQREQWIHAFRGASCVVPVKDLYDIKGKIGCGNFSVVYECVHKINGHSDAIKIIDKKSISQLERDLLKSEINILRQLDHPNIIKTQKLYEDDESVYIVMEKQSGDLFSKVVGRPLLTEYETSRLVKKLLESVAYLHDLNIVHRDLKPENILCGDTFDDIKLADFGLSRRIHDKKKLNDLCGTVGYVAPEILLNKGYGKEVDVWSIGVTMFLVLIGKLPFNGYNDYEIIQKTIKGELKVTREQWSKLSDEATSLISLLLNVVPLERITARNALQHPFILIHADKEDDAVSVPVEFGIESKDISERQRFLSDTAASTDQMSSSLYDCHCPCSPQDSPVNNEPLTPLP